MAGHGHGGPSAMKSTEDCKALLNTSIHNYFLNENLPDLASRLRSSNLPLNMEKLKKDGPNNQVNGADDGLDGDSKDDIKIRNGAPGDTLLLDYWFIFWDMWKAAKDRGAKPENNASQQYLMQQQRAQIRQPIMQQGMVGYPNAFGRGGPNQMNNTLARDAMARNGRNASMNPQFGRGPQHLGQQPMQRDGSDNLDMNGQQQPGSPMSGDNAPSPTKRQRLDGQFNGQQMGVPMRGPIGGPLPSGAGGNQQAMMIQQNALANGVQNGGYDPKTLSPAGIANLISGNKQGQQAYSQSLLEQQRSAMNQQYQTGYNGNPGQISPGGSVNAELAFDMPQMMQGQTLRQAGGNGGALADYQMQLMLLEQQNKKRLMMARQEQDVHGTGTLPGAFPQGSSPHNRGSPPDTKRNTPKPGQGSPLPDGSMQRNSPIPGNFEQMNNMGGQFMPAMKGMMGENIIPGANGNMIRPPSSHPMSQQALEALQRGQRLPNGPWVGAPMQGPMMVGPGQPNQPDGNQPNQQPNLPRGTMAPPQAPAGANKAQSSPTPQNNQPPTPSTTNKAPPKRKETKDGKKKAGKKGAGTTNATPNPEIERATTPTPATPITPNHPEAASIKGQQGQTQDQPQQIQQGQNPNMQQQPGQQPNTQPMGTGVPSATNMPEPFGAPDLFTMDFEMGTGMSMEDTNGILDGFDFETFINEPMTWTDNDFGIPGDGGLGAETGP